MRLPDTQGAAVAPSAPQPRTVVPANDTIDLMLAGRIAAGTPIEALQGQDSFPGSRRPARAG
jgi:repressor LexA